MLLLIPLYPSAHYIISVSYTLIDLCSPQTGAVQSTDTYTPTPTYPEP